MRAVLHILPSAEEKCPISGTKFSICMVIINWFPFSGGTLQSNVSFVGSLHGTWKRQSHSDPRFVYRREDLGDGNCQVICLTEFTGNDKAKIFVILVIFTFGTSMPS